MHNISIFEYLVLTCVAENINQIVEGLWKVKRSWGLEKGSSIEENLNIHIEQIEYNMVI